VSDEPLPAALRAALGRWRAAGETIAFTNGVFDLLHRGHVDYLVVGLNSDASVRRLKGPERPVVPEAERLALLEALGCVDAVVGFDDDTPETLIRAVEPDVLVKGGDWPVERIVGREFVERRGGRVVSVPLTEGFGTSALIERIRAGKSALDP